MNDARAHSGAQAPPSPLIPLRKLNDALPWLPQKHYSQYYRWVTRGLKGRRLQAVRVGGTWCTCVEWLTEFFAARSNALPATTTPPMAHRTRSLDATLEELRRTGI